MLIFNFRISLYIHQNALTVNTEYNANDFQLDIYKWKCKQFAR